MPLRALSIQVSDRAARVYEAAPPHERRKLDAYSGPHDRGQTVWSALQSERRGPAP